MLLLQECKKNANEAKWQHIFLFQEIFWRRNILIIFQRSRTRHKLRVNWRLLAPLYDLLDLQTFLALRKAERATRCLCRLGSVYDIAVDTGLQSYHFHTFDQLMSLTGPVAELPFLRIIAGELPSKRPRIPHFCIESPNFELVTIPAEVRRLRLSRVDSAERLETLLYSVDIDRLDIKIVKNLKTHVFLPHHLIYFSCKDGSTDSAWLSFSVDTFEYDPCLVWVFRLKLMTLYSNCWHARCVILHLKKWHRKWPLLDGEDLVSVVRYCFAINTHPETLELHMQTQGCVAVIKEVANKFPNIKHLRICLDSSVCVDDFAFEDITVAFPCLVRVSFVFANNTTRSYVVAQKAPGASACKKPRFDLAHLIN
jgi:hypothetical protein